ncbi:unnamed protein product [Arctogadus glacialis]
MALNKYSSKGGETQLFQKKGRKNINAPLDVETDAEITIWFNLSEEADRRRPREKNSFCDDTKNADTKKINKRQTTYTLCVRTTSVLSPEDRPYTGSQGPPALIRPIAALHPRGRRGSGVAERVVHTRCVSSIALNVNKD